MPTAQAVNLVSPDLYVQVPQGNKVRQRGYFVLRGQHHSHASNGIQEAKCLDFRKALRQLKFPVAVNAGVGNRFVEGHFWRPLRDGVFALAAFVEPDVRRVHFVQQHGRSLDEEIRQARSRARIDQRGAVLFFKPLRVTELLGFKGIFCQVGAEIQVMRAQPQRRAQHNLVKDRSRRVDDELAALRRLHNAP